MKRTLGGDRLGSGKKMQVDLHEYGRSTHDLGYAWRSTASMGTLIPFMSIVGLPGDTFDIELEVDIKTHPTVGPLFGSGKVQLDIFEVPIRLYQAALHNNKLNAGRDIGEIKFPILQIPMRHNTFSEIEDIDNSQINPSCILHYLGIHGIGTIPSNVQGGMAMRNFNAIPLLAYWEIYKNYYANKQEEHGFVVHTDPPPAELGVVESVTIGGETVTEFPELVSIGTAGAKQVVVTFVTPLEATEEQLDKIKFNINEAGTSFRTLRQMLVSGITYDTTAGTITGYTNIASPVRVYSWDYVNQFQPREMMPEPRSFALSQIDDMREDILEHRPFNSPFVVNKHADGGGYTPYRWLGWSETGANGTNYLLGSQEGLALKTYQSDLFNNWLNTEWIDGVSGVNARSSVDVSSGSFTIDQLLLSEKVFEYLNRVMVAGASYDDWLDATWAVERHRRPESPVYQGSLIRELAFQEVISSAAQEVDGQPLGTLAGRGVMTQKRKGGKIVIKCDEPCYIMGIFSVTPRVDYSQGNKWDVHLTSLDDVHKPAMDQIGFQDLITEQMAWWDTHYEDNAWVQKSAGKQPAWINYMTAVNETHGNFAIIDNEMFMTFNRRYLAQEEQAGLTLADLTTYIDPAKFNWIWADTALDAQNLWVNIGVDIEARRVMSAKLMPNL